MKAFLEAVPGKQTLTPCHQVNKYFLSQLSGEADEEKFKKFLSVQKFVLAFKRDMSERFSFQRH